MKTGEIKAKSILNRSGIEGVDYSVNPYLGCAHACAYCYARFMTRFHHKGERWGTFVDAKTNAVERLREEAPRKRRGIVLLSSVTDAYQPLERKYELTRGSLKVLKEHGYPVEILTKSDLVLRDMDIITEIGQCEVGFTITSLDEDVRRAFEPNASPVQSRLEALKQFNDSGVDTYAFLGPLLPYLSEETLEPLLDTLADRVNRVIVDRLNPYPAIWPTTNEVLDRHYPDLRPVFKAATSKQSEYYDELRRKVARMCRERAIPADIIF